MTTLRLLVGTVLAPPKRSEHERSGGRRWMPWLLAAPFLVLVCIVLLIVVLLAGTASQQCGGGLPGGYRGPGSLDGVAGTGFTAQQIHSVRTGSPHAGERITGGRYLTTAYGPPWGGINGPGVATSGGLALGGGAPRWYMVAVDPLLIGHGRLVYVWPNPFRWRGPFLAADTGSAIRGRRIDFYDWRGRATQLGWGHQPARVSPYPIVPGGPAVGPVDPGVCATPSSGRVGDRIGQLARARLGRGPRIPGFRPPAVGYAWCAWFATNVWREAGVPIPISAWSGYPYDWAESRGQLFKAIGRPPIGPTPPVGAALMYGTNSVPPSGSDHINLVDRVLADGTFMVTGGNQDGSRVTRYGPCRLSRTDPARLAGPGCDARPIYGIAMPTKPGTA